MPVVTDLKEIALIATEKERENDAFRFFLKQLDSVYVDKIVHPINELITQKVDCTQCGNCCKSLMINITAEESESLAKLFQTDIVAIKEKYIEESQQGQMIMNTIPCHFLQGTTCSIYEHRFTECRQFPHLHKPDFTGRLFGTLMYYAICPIIFNVIEELKEKLEFTS